MHAFLLQEKMFISDYSVNNCLLYGYALWGYRTISNSQRIIILFYVISKSHESRRKLISALGSQ
jgi:hypothetical protein